MINSSEKSKFCTEDGAGRIEFSIADMRTKQRL